MPRRTSVFLTLCCALILSVTGIVLIYSASHRNFGPELAVKQSLWLLLGVVVAFFVARLSRQHLFQLRWVLYLGGLGLLGLTLFFGVVIRGDRSWLDLGLVHLQASEPMKLVLVLVLAGMSERIPEGNWSVPLGLLAITAVLAAPLVLVLLQPDLGTALIYVGFYVGWVFALGLWREAIVLVSSGVGAVVGLMVALLDVPALAPVLEALRSALWGPRAPWIWGGIALVFFLLALLPYLRGRRASYRSIPVLVLLCSAAGTALTPALAEYQKQRLRVYFDPYQAPLDTGYNIIQSQIAIGSGGWFGQGYLGGSQSQLGFIPELWTDFIFSVAVEELGLLFGLGMIGLLFLLVYGVFSTAALASDWRGYLVCAGIGIVWILHASVNLGVCVGLLPVVGLPLPFLSYGGSFMLTNWFMIGVLVAVSRRARSQAFRRTEGL